MVGRKEIALAIDYENFQLITGRRRGLTQNACRSEGERVGKAVRRGGLPQNPLRFARGERGVGEVDHLVATLVEFFSCRLFCIGRVEREKKHATLGAVLLFIARRVPALAEALGRQDDKPSAGLGNRVADGFFERAHESRNACAAWADSTGFGENRFGFARVERGCAMTFERVKNGRVQDFEIAVAEPTSTEKLDFANRLKIAGVCAARPGASGVLLNIAAKGGELAGFLNDPIVPIGGEDRGKRLRRRATRRTLATRRTFRQEGLALGGVCRHNAPIFGAQGFGELRDENAQRDALFDRLDFDQKMKMVGHDDEGRDFVEATPFLMKRFDDRGKGAGNLVFDQPVGPDLRECGKAGDALKRNHVKVRRLVVEAEEPSHGFIIAKSDGRRQHAQNLAVRIEEANDER